jgi:hypothetical protein
MPGLDELIEVFQITVELAPPETPNLPRYLSNLASGLRDRYLHTGDAGDLESAMRILAKSH